MEIDPTKTMALQRVQRSGEVSEEVEFLIRLSGPRSGEHLLLLDPLLRLGRDESCQFVLDELGVSRHHATLIRTSEGWDLLDEGSTNGTFVNDHSIERISLKDGDRIELGPNCGLSFGRAAREQVDMAQKLYQSAKLDALTLVFNRATFFERLQQEMAFSQRQGTPFGLLLFDIDHFKSVNDTHGHPAGDAVLRQVAERAREFLRLEDTLGRYGGEEFIILLRNTSLENAGIAGERLRASIAGSLFEIAEQQLIPVTISLGVAQWRPGTTQEQLLQNADQALYRAKKSGRNQVCLEN
jgi:two-component system cell cycle response regulator